MLKIPGIQSKEKNNFKKRQNIENSSSFVISLCNAELTLSLSGSYSRYPADVRPRVTIQAFKLQPHIYIQ